MAWNDGIVEELSKYLDELLKIGDVAGAAFFNTIDKAAARVEQEILGGVPQKTGGLKESWRMNTVSDRHLWYGYEGIFEGNAPNGEPYEKIANVLNYGRKTAGGGRVAATRFVSEAIRGLRGLDAELEEAMASDIAKFEAAVLGGGTASVNNTPIT
jgi:hypothetical protein